MLQDLLRSIKIKDMMTAPVITIKEWEDFHIVRDMLEVHDIRHLPVVDDSGRLVGLVSQRHLYRIVSPRRLENGGWYYDKDVLDSFILKKVMVLDPHTLKPENTLEEGMQAMITFKFGCIPIVDGGNRPVGIITRDSVIDFLLKYKG